MPNRKSLIVAADVAALRTVIDAKVDDIAIVKDTLEAFDYDPASLDTDDGAAIVKPAHLLSSQAGRWLLRGVNASLGALVQDPGRRATNVLRLASDVVSATTVTIGTDVYEIEIVNTDSTDVTAEGDFDVEEDPIVISAAAYPGTTWAVGILVRVEDEILRVSSVVGDVVTLSRAHSGTVAAAHADAEVIYKGDGVVATRIPVGLVTTLTPAAFAPALAAVINEHGTAAVEAVVGASDEVVITADEVGAVVLACTETLAGANNAWAAAAMYGGAAAAFKRVVHTTRVPKAVEIALEAMHFAFDFEPVVLGVFVSITATPGLAKAWDGSVSVDGNVVTLVDGGAEKLEATDTVLLIVSE